MGIDPLTHKPLSTTEPQTQQQQKQVSKADVESQVVEKNTKEPETSLQSSTTTAEAKEEDNKSMTLFDPMDMMMMNNNIDGNFCTDEVPLIEPHEILVPNNYYAPSTSTSSSSSSSSSSDSSKAFLEELHFSDFEWPSTDCNTNNNNILSLWNDDDFSSTWDLLINNDDDSDRKLGLDHNSLSSSPQIQCQRMGFDHQDSWVL